MTPEIDVSARRPDPPVQLKRKMPGMTPARRQDATHGRSSGRLDRRRFLAGSAFGASAMAIAALTASDEFVRGPDAEVLEINGSDFGSREVPPRILPVGGPAADAFAVVTDVRYAGGADPTGNSDSSAAFRAAAASGRPVFVPTGTYRWAGPGIDHPSPQFIGAGASATRIALTDSTYFVDSTQQWSHLSLSGLRFVGGAGCIRNSYTGSNVTQLHIVTDCEFLEYSECAISHESSDHPYWKIQRNVFRSSNYLTSMGVALSGLSDGTTIEDNEFLANRVHVKLRKGGNNTYIQRNDFLRFGPPQGFPRIDVWIVPAETEVNSGAGLVITRSKFGNEFLDPGDFRILYADEQPAARNCYGFPELNSVSSGWVSGHTVAQVLSNGIGDRNRIPMVFATTSNILGGIYGPIVQAGSSGAPILAVRSPLRFPEDNTFGPLLRASPTDRPPSDLVVVVG